MDTITSLKEQVVALLSKETDEYRQKSFTKQYDEAMEDIYPAIHLLLRQVLNPQDPRYNIILTACALDDPSLTTREPKEECDLA